MRRCGDVRCKQVCYADEDPGELRVGNLQWLPFAYVAETDTVFDNTKSSAGTQLDIALGLAEHTYTTRGGGDFEASGQLEERPRRKLTDGSFYSGQWMASHRHGQGRIERAGWGCYEGQFVCSKATGSGSFTKVTGDIYTGQWLNDRAHGRGHYVHSDGSTYDGEWDLDKKNGSGIETWPDDSRYEGTFSRGRKHGHGFYQASDKSSYDGQFVEDMMQGHGRYVFTDGRVYNGRWEQSRMQGDGCMTWPDGKIYNGQFKDDKKSGIGRFIWPGGCTYEGQWYQGRQHGEGVYIGKKGRHFTGTWDHGKNLTLSPPLTQESGSSSRRDPPAPLSSSRKAEAFTGQEDFNFEKQSAPKLYAALDSRQVPSPRTPAMLQGGYATTDENDPNKRSISQDDGKHPVYQDGRLELTQPDAQSLNAALSATIGDIGPNELTISSDFQDSGRGERPVYYNQPDAGSLAAALSANAQTDAETYIVSID